MIHLEDQHPGATRLGHEMLTEDVIEIRVEYTEQTFRHRRTFSMLDVIGGREPEPGDDLYEELMDCAHRTIGRRPLV